MLSKILWTLIFIYKAKFQGFSCVPIMEEMIFKPFMSFKCIIHL